jgi:phosphatidylserine/phosphatidylglycerophosphate/cardiolipin synthase-like enzyme
MVAVVCLAAGVLAGGGAETHGTVELVESVPTETELDLPRLRNTPDVWVEMVAAARRTIDIETFYMSNSGTGRDRLDAVLRAVEQAAKRGVAVRALADEGFYHTYPEVLDFVGRLPGAATRRLDVREHWGGVLHAKFFVVDSRTFFVGSQNWDWRALEHIHELGVRVDHAGLAEALRAVFEMDWVLAGEEEEARSEVETPEGGPVSGGPFALTTSHGDPVTTVLAASPPSALPPGIQWDQPILVQSIDGARERIRLQLLTFNPVDRQGRYHEALESALRRAAARGVDIDVILSDWSSRDHILPYVKSLAAVPGIDVRMTTIPQSSQGFIPYARVEHPKYLVADDDVCWIGTSNWSRSGFHDCRNISLFFYGRGVAETVSEFFDGSWTGPYAEDVDPCRTYQAPRISR